MAACAYCGKLARNLTREHLLSASLHRNLRQQQSQVFGSDQIYYIARCERVIDAEPTVRDVCSDCNNGPLSILDSYICELWDLHFRRIVEPDELVLFSYDYDLLTRWLLKVSYNSARVHASDTVHLDTCRSYILEGGAVPDHVRVHLQLISPSPLIGSEIQIAAKIGYPLDRLEPSQIRIGHLGYPTPNGYGRLIRTVYLQSYLFLIHLFPTTVPEEQRLDDLNSFRINMPHAQMLSRERHTLEVVCKGIDVRETAFMDARLPISTST